MPRSISSSWRARPIAVADATSPGTTRAPDSGRRDRNRNLSDVLACLRALVRHRLAIAHPGYDHPDPGVP